MCSKNYWTKKYSLVSTSTTFELRFNPSIYISVNVALTQGTTENYPLSRRWHLNIVLLQLHDIINSSSVLTVNFLLFLFFNYKSMQWKCLRSNVVNATWSTSLFSLLQINKPFPDMTAQRKSAARPEILPINCHKHSHNQFSRCIFYTRHMAFMHS